MKPMSQEELDELKRQLGTPLKKGLIEQAGRKHNTMTFRLVRQK